MLALMALPATSGCDRSGWCASPEGPSQFCRHDAGPPWADDAEHFPGGRYHDASPAAPLLAPGSECPAPLTAACSRKGAKAAHLDGPVDCGGRGWFCRSLKQRQWVPAGGFRDANFAHCNVSDADERDDDGHCHGSSADDTYGWWVRDHWFRGYAGTLHCCCDWRATAGLVNRCDYRRHVDEADVGSCRDANERHGLGYEDGCAAHASVPFVDPLDSGALAECWSVASFADPESVPAWDGSLWRKPPSAPAAPSAPLSPPPSPLPTACPELDNTASCGMATGQHGRRCTCHYVWEPECDAPARVELSCL
jgi:hypothetical protein